MLINAIRGAQGAGLERGSPDFYQNPGVQVFGQNFKWDLLFWVLFHLSSREGGSMSYPPNPHPPPRVPL